jgi:hypothetical protein
VTKKEVEKILKYNDLITDIQRMWNIKTKSFRKYLSSIPGKHDIKELQKTATLGTAHILQKVLM